MTHTNTTHTTNKTTTKPRFFFKLPVYWAPASRMERSDGRDETGAPSAGGVRTDCGPGGVRTAPLVSVAGAAVAGEEALGKLRHRRGQYNRLEKSVTPPPLCLTSHKKQDPFPGSNPPPTRHRHGTDTAPRKKCVGGGVTDG